MFSHGFTDRLIKILTGSNKCDEFGFAEIITILIAFYQSGMSGGRDSSELSSSMDHWLPKSDINKHLLG